MPIRSAGSADSAIVVMWSCRHYPLAGHGCECVCIPLRSRLADASPCRCIALQMHRLADASPCPSSVLALRMRQGTDGRAAVDFTDDADKMQARHGPSVRAFAAAGTWWCEGIGEPRPLALPARDFRGIRERNRPPALPPFNVSCRIPATLRMAFRLVSQDSAVCP